MKHTFNKMLASGAFVAGTLLIATMLSAQAPAGGAAPAGAPGTVQMSGHHVEAVSSRPTDLHRELRHQL